MTATRRRPHDGFTLVELIVVLAVLGAMASVVGLVLQRSAGAAHPRDGWHRTVAAARARALATGRPVHIAMRGRDSAGTGGHALTAFPDGSVVTSAPNPDDTADRRPVDRLTGVVVDRRTGRRGP